MLDPRLPKDQDELTVSPIPVEIVLTDDDSSPLSLIMPPVEDLEEMRSFNSRNFSLKNIVEREASRSSHRYDSELTRLISHNNEYKYSSTYQNRLANLAAASGKNDLEKIFLEKAVEYSPNLFFSHRLSGNLVESGMFDAAERLLTSASLPVDSQTCLRLAFFHTRRLDFEQAAKCVERAVVLDPIDYAARLFEGALRLVEGQYEKAISSFRIAEETKSSSSVLYCNMGIAYLRMEKLEKAMASLKRSVALNPLNTIAVILFADVATKSGKDHEAIPTLRLYLQFEQKDASVWARLSRSLLANGQIEESIAALKRQGSLSEDDATIWNNLGVAYHRKGDKKRAAESYKKAIELDGNSRTRTFFLAAKNFAVLLQESARPKDLLNFTTFFFNTGTDYNSLTDREYAELIMLRIHALFRSDNSEEAVSTCEKILNNDMASDVLRMWVLIALLSWYPLNDGYEKSFYLAKKYAGVIDDFSLADQDLRTQLINNLAFTFGEGGYIEDAYQYIGKISHRIHKDCYPTATLGLIYMRKGDFVYGKKLYEESIRLAIHHDDKVRIKQKYFLELAKIDIDCGDLRRASKNLKRVVSIKDGEPGLVKSSQRLLLALQQPQQANSF